MRAERLLLEAQRLAEEEGTKEGGMVVLFRRGVQLTVITCVHSTSVNRPCCHTSPAPAGSRGLLARPPCSRTDCLRCATRQHQHLLM